MVDRIKQIMEYYQLSPASFAEQIGINRSNLTHLFSGRNQPSLELAKKILIYYPDIKTEWLIMGVGDMFKTEEDRELLIQLQNERNKQTEGAKSVDLFSHAHFSENLTTQGESPVRQKKETDEPIHDSREVERIEPASFPQPVEKEQLLPYPTSPVEKIVFFYSDKSFEIFHSSK
jgi:transcriptional regulator with XRE-family HTH domain